MESFILYTSQYSAIKDLSRTQKGEILDALYNYALTGTVPKFSLPQTEMAFNFMRIRIDENETKYLNISKKRSLAGRRGGRPKKDAATKENEKTKKANDLQESKKSKCKQKKLTDTDTESRSISINPDTSSDTLDSKVADDTATLQKKQKQKKACTHEISDLASLNFDDDKKLKEQWEEWFKGVLSLFNEAVAAHEAAIRPVRTLSDSRRKALSLLERKYHYTAAQFKQAFRNIAMSNYCNGRTSDRRRPVDFDWLIREENFNRAYEGSL